MLAFLFYSVLAWPLALTDHIIPQGSSTIRLYTSLIASWCDPSLHLRLGKTSDVIILQRTYRRCTIRVALEQVETFVVISHDVIRYYTAYPPSSAH